MRTLKVAIAATLLTGMASAARADLTYQGAVGMPLNPTANMPGTAAIQGQAGYYDMRNGDKLYGAHVAGSLGGKVEVSGGIDKLSSSSIPGLGKTGGTVGVKYVINQPAAIAGVRVAVGAGYQNALAKNYHVYTVATKGFGRLEGSLGVRYDHYNFDRAGGGTTNRTSVYAGVEVPLSPTGEFSAVGELQTKNVSGGDAPYSIAARYHPTGQPLSATVGLQRQGLGDSGLFATVNYAFGR